MKNSSCKCGEATTSVRSLAGGRKNGNYPPTCHSGKKASRPASTGQG